VAVTEQLIEGELQLLALDAHLEGSAQLEDDDPWLELFLDDLHKHLSLGLHNSREDNGTFSRAIQRQEEYDSGTECALGRD